MASQTAAQETPSEQAVCEVVDCVCNHPRHRELLYKALAFCRGGVDEQEAWRYVADQPEYAEALQEASVLVGLLVRHGGVVRTDVDATGELVDEARTQGLSADEVRALVAGHRLTTTPAGEATLALLSPQRRIEVCVREVPEREDAFLTVLQLCREPQSLANIRAALAGNPALAPSERTSNQPLSPTFFIDRLADAGALVWDGAWVTTQEGLDFLEAC